MLNKQKGNMYGFVTHTWNPIKGKCRHDCKYCYMKVWKQKPIRLVEKELKDNLGEDNFIFVGSSTDMFADDVPNTWIKAVLNHCDHYRLNRYLFQTKNPEKMNKFLLPDNSVVGTTIETNRDYYSEFCPPISERVFSIKKNPHPKMVTIEPIMDFDFNGLLDIIADIKPQWVNVGADSKGHNLDEPCPEKLKDLIRGLKEITKVKIKPNLERLYSRFQNKKNEVSKSEDKI